MSLIIFNIARRLRGVYRTHLHNVTAQRMTHTPSISPLSRIVWIDLELTGLNPEKDVILEVACVITEASLNEVGPKVNVVVHQPKPVLEAMVQWCQENHRKSGLYDEVVNSTINVHESETRILEHLQEYVPKGECCLAGNSVYMDRIFLAKYMPKVNEYLHYRIIDVSSIKELCRRWNREIYIDAPQKLYIHRALEDVLESINELKYYKQAIFDPNLK